MDSLHSAADCRSLPPASSGASAALTAYEIVRLLGGKRRVSEHCQVAGCTVAHWYLVGLPASRVPQLYALAQADGLAEISFAALHAAAARPARPKRPDGTGTARQNRNRPNG